jgi:hypothetical protein
MVSFGGKYVTERYQIERLQMEEASRCGRLGGLGFISGAELLQLQHHRENVLMTGNGQGQSVPAEFSPTSEARKAREEIGKAQHAFSSSTAQVWPYLLTVAIALAFRLVCFDKRQELSWPSIHLLLNCLCLDLLFPALVHSGAGRPWSHWQFQRAVCRGASPHLMGAVQSTVVMFMPR